MDVQNVKSDSLKDISSQSFSLRTLSDFTQSNDTQANHAREIYLKMLECVAFIGGTGI
jgi:hypothetical protein